MSQLKKSQVVMLPTNQKVNNKYPINQLFLMSTRLKLGTGSPLGILGGYFKPQHLYFLSDDEIKEGDWKLCLNDNSISQYLSKKSIESDTKCKDCKKIIATTNPKLNTDNRKYIYAQSERIHLPQPSQAFLEKYIDAYNIGKPITHVMVEYEDKVFDQKLFDFSNGYSGFESVLKVNPNYNTITIKKVKDSWSRDEVIAACKRAWDMSIEVNTNRYKYFHTIPHPSDFNVNKWIEENL